MDFLGSGILNGLPECTPVCAVAVSMTSLKLWCQYWESLDVLVWLNAPTNWMNWTCEWTWGLQPSRILCGLLGYTPVRLVPLQGLLVNWMGR